MPHTLPDALPASRGRIRKQPFEIERADTVTIVQIQQISHQEVLSNLQIMTRSYLALKIRAWLFEAEKNAGTLLKVSYAGERKDGEVFVPWNSIPVMAEFNDFDKSDIATIFYSGGQPVFIYNHASHLLKACFNYRSLGVTIERGLFPLSSYNKLCDQMASTIATWRAEGRYLETGPSARARRMDGRPRFESYGRQHVWTGYIGSLYKCLKVLFKLISVAVVVALIVACIGVGARALTSRSTSLEVVPTPIPATTHFSTRLSTPPLRFDSGDLRIIHEVPIGLKRSDVLIIAGRAKSNNDFIAVEEHCVVQRGRHQEFLQVLEEVRHQLRRGRNPIITIFVAPHIEDARGRPRPVRHQSLTDNARSLKLISTWYSEGHISPS